ncbi:MAG TPA: class I tRNA ligase family protein, partial [Miltoncostaeaceae bacterium]|nr:class I tRNA ligase family protein [Miltoncostaeaceae bacterium]
TAVLPLVGRELPIVADEHADPEFGTGALKVTPAHDPNDFEIARRHDLPAVGVIGEDGLMTPEAGARYAGLTPAAAAELVMADLRAEGLVRGEEPYTHTVPFSHRSGARVEPLVSLQWFCDMSRLAAPAIAAVEQGRVRFTPAKWGDVYLGWMREIRPWCISRQLWWGHQIPVWYRGEEVHVGREAPAGKGWERDPDVLDTWFSSALWPFATLGWPERTPELERFYPTQVLSTARDIIFLWVARMVMMGCEFMGEEPFADVAIHSVVQAPDGRRMSKSLGTGIDPMDEIERHGADALRFGLLMMSSTQDVRFSQERIDQGRQLVTKLWNAMRLVVERGGRAGTGPVEPATLADRWIASRVAGAVERGAGHLARFELAQLADLVYHVVFDDYCDWYLELLKAGEGSPEMAGAALEQLLALAHPLMPFVTEEGWSRMPGSAGLMAVHPAAAAPGPRDGAAEAEMAAVQEAVTALRGYRSRRGLPPRAPLLMHPAPHPAVAALDAVEGAPAGEREGLVPTLLADGRSIEVGPARGAVDPEVERLRLADELATAERELARAEAKLANAAFVDRAPPHLVEAERAKLERYGAERDALTARLAALQ